MYLRSKMRTSTDDYSAKITRLKDAITGCDAVVIGAGAGLSTSAGFVYSGERFEKYFPDFIEKYGFKDMYSGGFYPFESLEEHWAYWSRYIFINRYLEAPKNTYNTLFELLKDKDYFVITTNVDHQFQKAGFDKNRLFYTQGDFGLFQCSEPCHDATYDNEDIILKMVEQQKDMRVPTELIPRCPECNRPMTMNLRADNKFVENSGWHKACERYNDFICHYRKGKVLYLELGVGYKTPIIIKYPFWKMTAQNPDAVYACINYNEAFCPDEIEQQSVCIDGDIDNILCYI